MPFGYRSSSIGPRSRSTFDFDLRDLTGVRGRPSQGFSASRLPGEADLTIIARLNAESAIAFARAVDGRFSRLTGALRQVYETQIIPATQEQGWRLLRQAVASGAGRSPGRQSAYHASQRPVRLLEEAFRRQQGLWEIKPGAEGFRLNLDALDQWSQTRDGTSLRQYWRIQSFGTTQFVGRQVAILRPAPSLAAQSRGATGRHPGYQVLRDLTNRGGVATRGVASRSRKSRQDDRNPFAVGRVSRAIPGYRLDELAGRALRTQFETGLIARSLVNAAQQLGIPLNPTTGPGFGRVRRLVVSPATSSRPSSTAATPSANRARSFGPDQAGQHTIQFQLKRFADD